jgi:hypothetical protein
MGCLSKLSSVQTNSLHASLMTVRLPSVNVGKLKYRYTDAFGYNKCKLESTLGVAFMARCINGEIEV